MAISNAPPNPYWAVSDLQIDRTHGHCTVIANFVSPMRRVALPLRAAAIGELYGRPSLGRRLGDRMGQVGQVDEKRPLLTFAGIDPP
jgi:hypothetical protein